MNFQALSKSSSIAVEDFSTRSIEWPTPQDYQEAIQNPSTCFALQELAEAESALDAIGMPRVVSGAFASVYRMRCHGLDRAVRCFLHPVRDQQFRYELLSAYIRETEIPWTVSFEYMNEGIKVRNKWYPILMMDWVDGDPINSYACALSVKGDRQGIENLRLHFQQMLSGLKTLQIAHGDLQHGNILVRDSQIVLVDYDGFFVPSLKDERSNELGHPNYQHPRRSAEHFDPNIDRFSAWVIDTALLCLREDPSLISINYGGGESMLFHRHDFLFPDESAVLIQLSKHRSQAIRQRIDLFRQVLLLNIDEIPDLPDLQNILTEKVFSPAASQDAGSSGSASHDRLHAISKQSLSEQKKTENLSGKKNTGNLPDWLEDLEDPNQT